MQDIVRTLLIKMILVTLIIRTGMTEMIMMMMMMMMMIIIITIIIITIKPGEVSENKKPTICMTQTLSSLCGQNQMTSGSTAAISRSNSTLLPPRPSRRSNKVDRRKKFKKRSRDSSGKHIGLPLPLVTG